MNFLDGEHDASVTERIVNAYLPIVLYTALVISAILTGFVFTRPVHARENTEPVRVDQVWPHANEGAQGEPVVAPGQREIAVAYTLPIVAVAVALIFGLIVYDITQTRLEAWIWVIVLTIVAVGLTIGAIFASRAMRPLLRAGIMPKGVSVGAKNLNFVLSVLFAVTVTGMAMGYGTSAIYQLQVQPMLSISAYSQSEFGGNSGMPVEDMIFNVWGADLERGSEATLTVEPVGEFVATKTVDRYGSVSFEEQAAEGLEPGTYELVVEAATIDGRTPTVSMTFTVTEELRVEIPGSSGEHIEEAARIITPNLGWYLGDLLAAAVLLALVCGTLYVTLNARNTQFSRHDLQQLRLASAAESD